MVKNEISFLFNTERLLLGMELPEISDRIDNIKLSSPDLIVYSNDIFEVVISDLGLVSITTPIDIITEFKSSLLKIINEYHKLSKINNMFYQSTQFKIITPKSITHKVTDELKDLHYMISVTDTNDSDTISVTH